MVVASINRLSPILAIAVGVIHAGLAPILIVGGIRANVALVACVLVAASAGFGPGITWAFLAGLTANLLASEPLGSLPLILLVVCAAVALAAPRLAPLAVVYPVLAVFLGSMVADVGILLLRPIVGGQAWVGVPVQIVIGAALLNAAIAAAITIAYRVLSGRRRTEAER